MMIHEVLVNEANLTADDRYYPTEEQDRGCHLEATSECVLAMVCTSGVTVTLQHAAVTSAEAVPASGDWIDVTSKFQPLSGAASASYVNATNVITAVLPPGRLRVKSVTSDGSNTVKLVLYRREVAEASVSASSSGGGGDASEATLATRASEATVATLATEATVATLATQASLVAAQPRNVAMYNATTAAKTSAARDAAEMSKVGSTYVDATVRHQREIVPLAVSGAGAAATLASLAEGPCNGISVDTDDVHVFGQPIESALLVVNGGFTADTNWTKGAGWTIAANKATHAAAGGTNTLLQDTSAENAANQVLVNRTYAVYFEMADRTAGSVTCKLGSTGVATAAVSANGGYIALLTAATEGDVTFTPTDDFDGSITNVKILPASQKLKAGQIYPLAYTSVVAIATAAALTTFTSNRMIGHWLRRIGATENV